MPDLAEHWGKLTALLGLLVALAAAVWAPGPSAVRRTGGGENAWNLPATVISDPAKALATIDARALWGKVAVGAAGATGAGAAAGAAEVNAPEWRFVGVTTTGSERAVLISIAGKATQSLHEGDSLPGGALILRIENERLCLSIDGKARTLDIFQ
jgi:hypothetical protein